MKNLTLFLYKIWLNAPILVVIVFVVALFAFLTEEALPFLSIAFKDYESVLLRTQWFPSEGKFGVLALIFGTLGVLAGGLSLSIVFSFAIAISLLFYLPGSLKHFVFILIELFSGIPPIVVGVFGITFMVPLLAKISSPGFGIMSSSIVLAVLLIPSMALHWFEIFTIQNEETLAYSQSLGISTSRYIKSILLPASSTAILSSIVLFAQRGLAETLAIVMVAGNVVQIPTSLFEPIRTINATIALEIPYAEQNHRSSLFFLALVLFSISIGIALCTHAATRLRSLLQTSRSKTNCRC